jgi:hypothetical protein
MSSPEAVGVNVSKQLISLKLPACYEVELLRF